MSDLNTIKNQIEELINAINDVTENRETDLTTAIELLIDLYLSGNNTEIILAENVAFSSEHSDTTALYAMGYNWFADVVKHVQNMSGNNQDMTPQDMLYWLGKVTYLPQMWIISHNTITNSTTVVGSIE